MRVLAIANREGALGLRLAGASTIVVSSDEEAGAAFDRATTEQDVGLVMITESLARGIKARLDAHRLNRDLPLVLEVPEPSGTTRDRNYLARYLAV